jgi:hypothetical protein
MILYAKMIIIKDKEGIKKMIKKCRYCGSQVIFTQNKFGFIYKCIKCDAYVGVHKKTQVPLGTLANKELRHWRGMAHIHFDLLWKYKKFEMKDKNGRHKAYAWLAKEMGIKKNDCHIARFDIDECQRVIEICLPHYKKILKKIKEN